MGDGVCAVFLPLVTMALLMNWTGKRGDFFPPLKLLIPGVPITVGVGKNLAHYKLNPESPLRNYSLSLQIRLPQ